MRVLLISTYEMGRQPFGLASAAAWLRRAGATVATADLARERVADGRIREANLVALYLPMHTATRLAVPVIQRIRSVNPKAHLCCYGLYAPLNAAYLKSLGVQTILGGEFEAELADLVDVVRAEQSKPEGLHYEYEGDGALFPIPRPRSPIPDPRSPIPGPRSPIPGPRSPIPGPRLVRRSFSEGGSPIPRLRFLTPDRDTLPPLARYATLHTGEGVRKVVGYTEASRGCKHLCRHCPIVPVYQGQFRIVQPDVVLADIRAQVARGAEHITFGDPDFFNGIGHALRIVDALAAELPDVTYDVTIKIEHLLQHQDHLAHLVRTGCLFVTSAVESIDDDILVRLEKGHTRADFARVVDLCREVGLTLVPTFVSFTPWSSLDGYCELLDAIERLDLVEHVAPIQLGIRLLIPEGSRLLELPDVRDLVQPFDAAMLSYPWRHADARVDALQREIMDAIGARLNAPRRAVFEEIAGLAHDRAGTAPLPRASRSTPARDRTAVPYLNEPWFC